MGRIKSFRQLILETCWRIIWQFGLGLLLAYLIPLASVSIQIREDGKPLKNSGVLSIFFQCILMGVSLCFIDHSNKLSYGKTIEKIEL